MREILDRIRRQMVAAGHCPARKTHLALYRIAQSIDGISQRMLTTTLRQLERDGLIERTVYPVVPPRVDYALTELGCTLHDTIKALVVWTETNRQRSSPPAEVTTNAPARSFGRPQLSRVMVMNSVPSPVSDPRPVSDIVGSMSRARSVHRSGDGFLLTSRCG